MISAAAAAAAAERRAVMSCYWSDTVKVAEFVYDVFPHP